MSNHNGFARLHLTIGRIVAGHGTSRGDKVALCEGDRTITFARLHEDALRLAAYLERNGVVRGDRIAVWMPNSVDWVTIELAASLAGVGVVAINSRYKSDEVGYILGHSEAKLLFMVSRHRDTDFLVMLDGIAGPIQDGGNGIAAPRLPALRQVILCDRDATALPDPYTPYRRCLDEPVAWFHSEDDSESILNIIYTSGTTSRPKGVLLSERALVPHSRAVANWFGVGGDDVVLLLTPFCGIYGLNALLMTLAVGATGIVVPDFDPDITLDLIEKHKVTFIGGTVDSVVRRWAEALAAKPRDIGSIRGSTIPVGWMQGKPEAEMPGFEETLGVGLVHVYGLSETNSMVIVGVPSDDHARRHPVAGRKIWPGIEARIADPVSGANMLHGQAGEIRLRGPILFSGYLKNHDATHASFDAEGWFRTGDLGIADGEDYISYAGRLKDIIKVSGFTVSPAEIEAYLLQHPDISAAQVLGFNDGGNEALGVAIVKRAGSLLAEGDVIAFCKGRIASFKIPSRVIFLDGFPVKSSANSDKIDRAAIGALFEER